MAPAITCQRLKASGKAKYFWLSSSLGHVGSPEFFNGGQWHLFQNVIEIKRSYARDTFDTDVANPAAPISGNGRRAARRCRTTPLLAADILASRAFVKKGMRDGDRAGQRQAASPRRRPRGTIRRAAS